jgi:hypothetical protein
VSAAGTYDAWALAARSRDIRENKHYTAAALSAEAAAAPKGE